MTEAIAVRRPAKTGRGWGRQGRARRPAPNKNTDQVQPESAIPLEEELPSEADQATSQSVETPGPCESDRVHADELSQGTRKLLSDFDSLYQPWTSQHSGLHVGASQGVNQRYLEHQGKWKLALPVDWDKNIKYEVLFFAPDTPQTCLVDYSPANATIAKYDEYLWKTASILKSELVYKEGKWLELLKVRWCPDWVLYRHCVHSKEPELMKSLEEAKAEYNSNKAVYATKQNDSWQRDRRLDLAMMTDKISDVEKFRLMKVLKYSRIKFSKTPGSGYEIVKPLFHDTFQHCSSFPGDLIVWAKISVARIVAANSKAVKASVTEKAAFIKRCEDHLSALVTKFPNAFQGKFKKFIDEYKKEESTETHNT